MEPGPVRGDARGDKSDVVVPPTDGATDHIRLPIFEAVESDWFRGGRKVVATVAQGSEAWSSPADEGFRAAEAVTAPAADGTTQSGLPKRAPGANLVPGAAVPTAGEPVSATRPLAARVRSATENRNRFASYQHGIRQGRAAAVGTDPRSGAGATS
jgi:hypothetical protein